MSKPMEDLTGKKFGRWTVLKYYGKTSNGHYWTCQCSCPLKTIREVSAQSLRNGKSQSCGCLQKENASKNSLKDLTGQTFGKLIVIKRIGNKNNKRGARWLCQCSCGNYHEVSSNSLIQGLVKSCGCLFANRRKRNPEVSDKEFSKERLYQIWTGMKARCYNKNHKDYKYCGFKGVIVCSEWKDNFKAFYDWSLANGYEDDLTIDRIDTFGNYEPSNCRWITISEQQMNRRVNHY